MDNLYGKSILGYVLPNLATLIQAVVIRKEGTSFGENASLRSGRRKACMALSQLVMDGGQSL